jgi:predicted metal-dependent RNase
MTSTPSSDEHDSDDQPPTTQPQDVLDGETPVVVHPRGGAREVGRSCYQVETPDGTYLVDCGLNQGGGGQFPDFRGLDTHAIDAVFLTHAHIDHTGGLPVLEHQNLLADDAPIISTQPTAALAHVLLHDSLKIHLEQTQQPGRQQHFTRTDVEDVLARCAPLTGYDAGTINHHIGTDDQLAYRFGDAGHLLGSAWLMLEAGGRRVLFSGDLGGRSAHLCEIESPPSADTLFLESTYGNRDTHPSFRDARTTLYETAIDAIRNGIPVLIPTFAIGRAQEILQIFRERWRDLDEMTREQLQLIYDGLAIEATDRYHAFAGPAYLNEATMNYMQNAADFEPFLPDIANRPSGNNDRERLLTTDTTPIIVAPSGMLTGGLSPVYLHDLLTHYDEMRLILTGYQAEGTLGREIVDASGTADITITTWPIREAVDDASVSEDQGESSTDPQSGQPRFEHTLPKEWVRSIRGLSGHAARNRLLQFARTVDPAHVAFVHGEPAIQQEIVSYFEDNLAAAVMTRAAVQTPIPVYPPEDDLTIHALNSEAASPNITVRTASEAATDSSPVSQPPRDDTSHAAETASATEAESSQSPDDPSVDAETLDYLSDRLRAIDTELAALRNDDHRSEAALRALIRDEVESILEERE